MPLKSKLALYEPCNANPNRYFAFKLKQDHYIEPTEHQAPSKLLIISNIEGNFHDFRKLLLQSGIIDGSYHWIFGEGHLVITGNCLGENEKGVESLWLAYALEEKARSKGGYVHFILGRNEINNLNGKWYKKHPKYVNNKRTSQTPYVVLYDGNNELRRWLKTKNIVEKIGDLIISNADISNQATSSHSSLIELNNQVRKYCSNSSNLQPSLHLSDVAYDLLNDKYLLPRSTISQNNPFRHKIMKKKVVDLTYIFPKRDEVMSNHSGPNDQIDALLIENDQFYRIDTKSKGEKIYLTN